MSTQNALAVSAKTMTSREIANLTSKEHRHVRRDIEVMFAQLGKDASIFGRIYFDSMNREQQEYHLPYDETVCLLTGYDALARMAVIKRWQELESQAVAPVFNIPTSLSSALRLAAEQAETIEAQALQITAAQPAIEFVASHASTDSLSTFREVAKLLKANEADLRAFLVARHVIYRLNGEWAPYCAQMSCGRMVIKIVSDGKGKPRNQSLFTAKGVQWVAGEFAKFNIREEAEA